VNGYKLSLTYDAEITISRKVLKPLDAVKLKEFDKIAALPAVYSSLNFIKYGYENEKQPLNSYIASYIFSGWLCPKKFCNGAWSGWECDSLESLYSNPNCWETTTTTVQIPLNGQSDGVVPVERQKIPNAPSVVFDDVNHFELRDHPKITQAFNDLFDGNLVQGVQLPSFFVTPRR
jgi:hypothetical protein